MNVICMYVKNHWTIENTVLNKNKMQIGPVFMKSQVIKQLNLNLCDAEGSLNLSFALN